MDFENRPYKPLELERYCAVVDIRQLTWGIVFGVLLFGLTCIGETTSSLAKRNKEGRPIMPARVQLSELSAN